MGISSLSAVVEAILLDEECVGLASTRDLVVLQGLVTIALETIDLELVRRDRIGEMAGSQLHPAVIS